MSERKIKFHTGQRVYNVMSEERKPLTITNVYKGVATTSDGHKWNAYNGNPHPFSEWLHECLCIKHCEPIEETPPKEYCTACCERFLVSAGVWRASGTDLCVSCNRKGHGTAPLVTFPDWIIRQDTTPEENEAITRWICERWGVRSPPICSVGGTPRIYGPIRIGDEP